jgi:hypothetical protein
VKKDSSTIIGTYATIVINYLILLMKKVLDNSLSLCYNIYITIEKGQNARQPIAALPVHIIPFPPFAGQKTNYDRLASGRAARVNTCAPITRRATEQAQQVKIRTSLRMRTSPTAYKK